ncbi:MAG: hypothetical protein JWN63_3097 [Candidatus Acidoferrum typicum]|jgi:hypothetical protein|nr:hypothetical protein [Candidatus Acidoferrum typicum]
MSISTILEELDAEIARLQRAKDLCKTSRTHSKRDRLRNGFSKRKRLAGNSNPILTTDRTSFRRVQCNLIELY